MGGSKQERTERGRKGGRERGRKKKRKTSLLSVWRMPGVLTPRVWHGVQKIHPGNLYIPISTTNGSHRNIYLVNCLRLREQA